MNKLIYHIIMIALFLSGAFIVLLGYWYSFPYEPLTIKQPLKIVNKKVKAGELLLVEMDFTKNTKIIPDITIELVNGFVYQLEEVHPINPIGQNNKIKGIALPSNTPVTIDHPYHLRFRACYNMNPIRIVCVEYESEKFEVTK